MCLQFNQQLKLGGELAANDLKMVLEDKQKREREKEPQVQLKLTPHRNVTTNKAVSTSKKTTGQDQVDRAPLLGDSIFLRYLPVPFIKFLYENDEQSFLEIYRRHDYRHPSLIWNASMRSTLENKIKDNAKVFLQ